MCGAFCSDSWGCRCWVLGVGCWVLGVGCSVFGVRSWECRPEHRTPNTRSGATMMFERRGIVFTPHDLEGPAWVPLLAEAGLNLVALHGGVDEVIAFTGSAVGQRFLAEAEAA